MSPPLEQRPDMHFEYVEIDPEIRKKIDAAGAPDPSPQEEGTVSKWCVNADHSLALIYSSWVSSSIARMDDNSSFWYFVLIARGHRTEVEVIGHQLVSHADPARVPDNRINIRSGFPEACGIPLDVLQRAVGEAARVFEIGRDLDDREAWHQDDLRDERDTPDKLLYGTLPPLLQQCIDSVQDIDNMEQVFRRLCLAHFREQNVAVQHYHRFFLLGDPDSFAMFDVILWMYLHLHGTTTREAFIADYPAIANKANIYNTSEFKEHFCIGGDISFLEEHYLPSRLNEGNIIEVDGNIRIAPDYSDAILARLKSS